MKVLSWNINGIRASKVDLKTLFDSLDADVICLQETKVTRDQLDEPTAIVEGYSSYFSFSRKRSGYSGVATFCKISATPVKAEEGLTCLLNPKQDGKVGCYGDLSEFTDEELDSLDAEGRTVITQHKIRKKNGKEADLAIINVYCPRADPDREDRHLYKLRFFALLQTRAEALLQNGSHVIVLGDINTVHRKIDHCDPSHEEFVKKPSRIWLNQFLWEHDRDPDIVDVVNKEDFAGTTTHCKGGCFVDSFRYFYPDKEGGYTNWCTLTGARDTNYGRRLDYIFTDVELSKSDLKNSAINAEVEGSDHCPVKVELFSVFLSADKCPPLCTKNMPEFTGKQQKLSSFFVKQKKTDAVVIEPDVAAVNVEPDQNDNKQLQIQSCINQSTVGQKRSLTTNSTLSGPPLKKKKSDKKTNNGIKQANLTNFFSKPKPSVDISVVDSSAKDQSSNHGDGNDDQKQEENSVKDKQKNEESACIQNDKPLLSAEQSKSTSGQPTSSAGQTGSDSADKPKNTLQAWKSLLKGPPSAPLCKGHNEPCVLRTVKKPGPNKRKQFFVCARGEGLSTNPEARCDFFKWVDRKKS